MSGLPPGDFDGASSRPQDTTNPSGPSDIPSNKPGWYDPQHMGPWNPNQPVRNKALHKYVDIVKMQVYLFILMFVDCSGCVSGNCRMLY